MTRWRGPAADALRLEPLDELVAVYHRPSGMTHLVASPAPEILVALTDRALTLDELLAALGEGHEVIDADRAALSERVDELADAGLISPGRRPE